MNRSWTLFLGVVATVLFSLSGLVLVPNYKFKDLQPVETANGEEGPVKPDGTVLLGRKVYTDLGCIYCHSQQVRSAEFGSDIGRGWGNRRSVARDYIFDKPPLMGTMRTGPDLANIGARQPSLQWHFLHLYNPQITSPGSIMPPFPFLFKVIRRKTGDVLPSNSYILPAKLYPTPTYVQPGERVSNLVDYLKSLNHSYDVPEAK